MELKYTNEKAVLLLIALLKANGIKRVVVSPGTTNFTFVGSIQHDDFFQLYSCVDERSAAYMACGIATETGEPVVITCTGATAPRNYLPGLTEAYYRKLPILAICGHRGESAIGHLFDQQLDRRNEPVDVANEQIWLPFVKDNEDEQYCYNEIIKAIHSLYRHGGGPVLINLCTHYSPDMSVMELPSVSNVSYYTHEDKFPKLPDGRIAITLGSHKQFSEEETMQIDAFCASHDAVVFCDHTSGYYGKYAVHPSLQFGQNKYSELANLDLCINAGEISGDAMGVLRVWAPITWRVSEDGVFRNRTSNVSKIFEMSLSQFCEHYIVEDFRKEAYLQQCINEYEEIHQLIPELPFSNVWIAQQLASQIPQGSSLYLGIYNSLRSWNLFNLPQGVDSTCNVGGFGIDGILSSAIGRSIANPKRLAYCVLGDLSFFYDMNSLGNRHVLNNLRVMVINNGLGNEFRQYNNPAYVPLGEEVRPYIAAEGHYTYQTKSPIKAYVESIGYKYLSASSKDDFLNNVPMFVDPSVEQSIVFEVSVEPKDDTDAMNIISHLLKAEGLSTKKRISKKIKSIIGEEKIRAIKTLLK